MVEILDNYADSSVIELAQTSNLIEMYAEGVIDVIDKLEENEAIRSAYFTEATEEAEAEAGKIANKGVIATIAESIANIFSKIAAVFTKGKVSVKGAAQEKSVKSLADKVKECPAVPIKLQNVWEYNSFVEDTIDKHIRKMQKKNTMTLFASKCGNGSAIDALTTNLRYIASQMRTPSNKKFEILKTGAAKKAARTGKVVRRGVGAAGLATGAAAVSGKVTATAIAGKGAGALGLTALGHTAGVPMSNAAAATIAEALSTISVTVGAAGPWIAAAGVAGAAGLTLAAIHAVWSKCPKKLSMENVTIQELYNRLTSLDAGKFPSTLATDTANANKYFQQAETLQTFTNSTDQGNKGAVRYAQKVADLMNAYAEYHQALIDFYLSVIINIIKEGAKMTGKKAYVPKEMVTSNDTKTTNESVEDEYDNDNGNDETVTNESEFDADIDSDINDYMESVDDMEDYMGLDDFVAFELRDLNC